MARKSTPKRELPFHSLGVGLRNQDISKVSTFCKSVDADFHELLENIVQAKAVSPSQMPLCYNGGTAEMYQGGLQMIMSCIQENVHKHRHLGFTQNLTKVLQDHLSKGIKQVMTNLKKVQMENLSNKEIEKQTDDLLTTMTDHMMSLHEQSSVLQKVLQRDQERQQQQLQRAHTRERRPSVGSLSSFRDGILGIGASVASSGGAWSMEGGVSEEQRERLVTWDSLDERAVIAEGILIGELPFLQKYLTQRFGPDTAEWMNIINTGLSETLIFLQEKEMVYAKKMLQNMGFDARTKLRSICLYTPERNLRDYLALELHSMNALTEEEMEMFKFIHNLEDLYSCPSFKMAKILRTEDTEGDPFPDPLNLAEVLPSAKYSTMADCGDLVDMDVHNTETVHYGHVLMEWVRTWDTETRQKILLDQALYKKDVKAELVEDIPAAVIWNYLCTRQDIKCLCEWIDTQYPLQNKEVVVEPSWPFNLPIEKNLVDNMTGATGFTREIILDELARRGIFSTKEQLDFKVLTARLRKVQGLFSKPHIIERSDDPTVTAMQDLHRYFIKFCIEKEVPQLLYFYLDYWSLCVKSTNMDHFHLEKRIPPWVVMMLHFRKASASFFDAEAVFEASLACSRCVHTLNITSIEHMVEEGLIGTALATLMFSHDKLQRFLAETPEKAKQGLMSLPTLYQGLFDQEPYTDTISISTVYQILQGNIPFNPNRLFGWQSTHTNLTEDAVVSLPHFSNEELAKKYGHKEHLQFSYFLKQGRPCFAFCNFVFEEVQSSSTGQLSSKSIEKACLRVHWLGLKHFHATHITAACALFMEMLGTDSTVFRVHIQAANQIYAYNIKANPPGMTLDEKRHHERKIKEKIVSEFQQCVRSVESHCADVLSALEEATEWSIAKAHFHRLSFEAEHKWLLVLAFCKCHSLPFTDKFLEACVKENDWLKFLTHAQCYQYPPKQVLGITSQFSNTVIREHMTFIINNLCQSEAKQALQSPKALYKKDFRARLYARVGVANTGGKSDVSSSEDEDVGLEAQDVTMETDHKETQNAEDTAPVKVHSDNLFDLLLSCQKSPYPSRSLCKYCVQHSNPVLAVLATCFQERNLLDCLCSWLYASGIQSASSHVLPSSLSIPVVAPVADPGLQSTNLNTDSISSGTSWSLSDLLKLVLTGLTTSAMPTVYDGFYIFCPDTVVLPFLLFVAKFYREESVQSLKEHLAAFRQRLSKMKSENETLDCRLFPIGWIEELVLSVSMHILCETTVERAGKVLQLLDECRLMDEIKEVQKEVADISLLNKLYLVTRSTGIHINFKYLIDSNQPSFHTEWSRIITALQHGKHWKEAKVASELIGYPTKDITLTQLNATMSDLEKKDIWKYEEVQKEFWRDAEALLQRNKIDVFVAAQFFQEQGNKGSKSSAKEHLYQLAYKWLSKAEVDTKHSQGLLTQIWKSKIQGLLEKLKQENPESPPVQLTKEVSLHQGNERQHLDTNQLRKLSALTAQTACTVDVALDDEEEGALGLILNNMLDRGNVLEAQKVAVHFGFPSTDLNIIATCHKLASHELQPDSLDVAMRRLISNESLTSSGRFRKSSVQMVSLPRMGSSLSIASRLSDLSDSVTEENTSLSCIQLLTKHCTHGRQCCDVIQATYNIAKVLDIEYMETLAVNEFNLLNHIIKCELPDRYLLAKAYTQAVAIPDEQVAGFLCNNVVETLKVQLGIIPGSDNRPTLASLRSGISSNSLLKGGLIISEIVQLCENPALLGQCLLNQVISSSSSEVNPSLATLSMEVELLIYAHDCFTLACHMEGISDVLRTCKSVAVVLNQAEEFTLMVRLLTGVGRYSEMVYIFDILKQQHQFELLFRKGTDKENKLKLAILDYLQRYQPEDVETYTMAALHFTMYREISQMQEKAAAKLLKSLPAKTLENSSENQDTLHKALHSFSDAAENYVKVNCLRHAEDCVKKAKLVALQLQFLTSRTRVINLDPDAIRIFIRSHKKVHEVYVVLEAYNQSELWSEAVYAHVVQQGDFKYLTDLSPYVTLASSLITDVAERFRSEGHQNKQMSSNLHKLLLQCCDVTTALKLAKSLDLKDTLKELLKGPDGAYLKDYFQL